ncbi:hypothetical protein TVAG_373060 [Trichomonas vaginalis G3]|uniref:Uncharacterized protein n=1 Tax=Trichomonas vaginalis (strain ATCC PRA-98 / G3) TaxID=412133 RepID=A2DZG9_TRIV3|nr:hypothetical protein TVAGG3_0011600 [Trichomonas vaginalis G3]EAY14173.1 hypothetical protein TVAG_373060 [Trichomonas vaginalis G3]KAI5539171.1 hypothetical protein TVAGG3_0011600 [Trichomonas vaginalis G3]|eukprot:XP_001326396.1 hypothetical protein [Trichomonas vaginalis G3]
MDSPKIVLGLKAEKRGTQQTEESSDGCFFSSSSEGENLKISKQVPVFALKPQEKKKKIVGFSDASSRVTNILSILEKQKIPQKYSGPVFFIPEDQFSQENQTLIHKYAIKQIDTLPLNPDDFDDVFSAQIDIIHFIRDKTLNLHKYEDVSIDPRITSLIQFLIASMEKDKGVSCYYYLTSLEECLKCPSYAPISTIFPDFSIQDIINKIALDLVALFPRHPILPSVIHNLSTYCPEAIKAIDLIDQDTDDENSDSFFEFIKSNKMKLSTAPTVMTIEEEVHENVLDFANCQAKIETLAIAVTEPPETMTYILDDEGHSSYSATQFSEWLESLRPVISSNELPMTNWRSSIAYDPTLPYMSAPMSLPVENVTVQRMMTNSAHYYIGLYSYLVNQQKLLNALPMDPSADFFHLYYPTLQFLNQSTNNPVTRGCLFPNLIIYEHEAHNAMISHAGEIQQSYEKLLELIPNDQIERKSLKPIANKRKLPELAVSYSTNIVHLLAAADIEFIIDGRSPLTGGRISQPPSLKSVTHPISIRTLRATYLYEAYSTMDLPPFYAFRVGFGAALAYIDVDPYVSCSIMFELVYLVHKVMGTFSRTPIIRSSVLFFAETLERSDRYYHATLAFDNYFLSDIKDTNSSTAIAQMAQRNGDTIRALFFYTSSLKTLIQQSKIDESLYLGQTIAQIYTENGMMHLAVSLLSFLLRKPYNLAVRENFKIIDPQLKGTQRLTRPSLVSSFPDFVPRKNAINTMLVCCSYIDTLIRMRHYKAAEYTIESLQNAMEAPVLQNIIGYLKSRLFLKTNRYQQCVQSLPKLDVRHMARSATHISLLSGASFDACGAVVSMMMRGTLDRMMFRETIAWSEFFIYLKGTLREIGCGYLWRGMAFSMAYFNSSSFPEKVQFEAELIENQKKFLSYKKPTRDFTLNEIASEAISCFVVARHCFEKVGSTRKEIEASLNFCDIILHHFFDTNPVIKNALQHIDNPENKSTFNLDSEEKEIKSPEDLHLQQPALLTIPVQKHYKDLPKLTERTISSENALDECLRCLQFCEKNANRLMSITLIIYTQVLLAKVYFMLNKMADYKTYFDFAFTTIKKLCLGPHFVPVNISTYALKTFEHSMENLVELLAYSDKDFINDHLLIFDLLSDIKCLIGNRLRNIDTGLPTPIYSSAEMDFEVLSLKNPRLPSFENVLVESGYDIDQTKKSIEARERSLDNLFSCINANIRLYETQKIDSDTVHIRNRGVCKEILKTIESIQEASEGNIATDVKFSTLLRHNKASSRTVLVQRLFNGILVYIPMTGQKRICRFNDGHFATLKSILIEAMGSKINFDMTDNFLPKSFFECLLGYVLVDKKGSADKFNNPALYLSTLLDIKEKIFGVLLRSCTILQQAFPIKDDELPIDNSWFSKKKGRFITVAPCPDLSINFVVSHSLQSLPLEIMFRESLVTRVSSFTSLVLPQSRRSVVGALKVVVYRRIVNDRKKARWDGIQRSAEIVRSAIYAFGSAEPSKPYVDELERTLPYIFPLFSSNKNTDYYANIFKFCNFREIKPNATPSPECGSLLYIFTYADLCEMPMLVERIFREVANAFCLFIPANQIRAAFDIMKDMFERQKSRSESNDANQRKIFKQQEDFVCAMQLTLIKILQVPIPLFYPVSA